MKYLTWHDSDSFIRAGWKEIDKLPFDLPKQCIIIPFTSGGLTIQSIFSTDMSGIVIEIDIQQKTFWITIDGSLVFQIQFDDYDQMNSLVAQMIGVETYDVLLTT